MFLLWFSKLLLNFVDLYCSKELLHCKLITNWRLVSGLAKDVDFTIFVQAIQNLLYLYSKCSHILFANLVHKELYERNCQNMKKVFSKGTKEFVI